MFLIFIVLFPSLLHFDRLMLLLCSYIQGYIRVYLIHDHFSMVCNFHAVALSTVSYLSMSLFHALGRKTFARITLWTVMLKNLCDLLLCHLYFGYLNSIHCCLKYLINVCV